MQLVLLGGCRAIKHRSVVWQDARSRIRKTALYGYDLIREMVEDWKVIIFTNRGANIYSLDLVIVVFCIALC